jgi:hypothetical protein
MKVRWLLVLCLESSHKIAGLVTYYPVFLEMARRWGANQRRKEEMQTFFFMGG